MTLAALSPRPETDTRGRIMATAEDFFRTIGYQKTTVADIAKALKMSPANVYRFFDSKKAINEAVAERLMGEVEAALDAIAAGEGSATERLRRLAHTCHAMNAERYTDQLKMHEMVEVAMTESWGVIQRHIERVHRAFEQVIADGQRSGEFSVGDATRATYCTKAALLRFFHPQMIVQCTDEPGPTLDEMVEFILAALKHRGA